MPDRASDYPTPKPPARGGDKFSFRPQHPGESDAEYSDHKGKAQKRFNALDRGRSGAVKDMLKARKVSTRSDSDEAQPYEP